tara:strand:- start:262 stop:684 length:423 start_codon:yes stop_codon:yes gene_type:complete
MLYYSKKTSRLYIIQFSSIGVPAEKRTLVSTHFLILLLGATLLEILSFLGVFWRHYNAMTLKAKNSEARKNLKEICQTEQEYFRRYGVYLEAGPRPKREPNNNPTPFDSPLYSRMEALEMETRMGCSMSVPSILHKDRWQ